MKESMNVLFAGNLVLLILVNGNELRKGNGCERLNGMLTRKGRKRIQRKV